MKTHPIFVSVFIFLTAALPSVVCAIGVFASPATLSLKTSVGKEVVARFTVKNPSKEVGLFSVYPEEFEGDLTLIPSRFLLEAGEKREVVLRARRREAGSIQSTIAVEAEPLGVPALSVGGGVRLPFSLQVSGRSGLLSAVSFSGASSAPVWVFLGALTAFAFFRRVPLSTLKRLARSVTLW